MILVVGASGNLGRRVVERLLERGLPVRALSRDPGARLAGLAVDGVEVVRGDVRDRASLERAMDGVGTVLGAVHGLMPFDRRNTILHVDREGNRNLVDAARAAGVGHFVLMSACLASPDCPCLFGRVKAEAEAYLRASGLPATVIRPTAFMEAHVLMMFGDPARSTGKVRFFGRGQGKLNYVATDDVADVVADAVADGPPTAFRSIEVGGPEDFTRGETVDMIERALGTPIRRGHVPTAMMRVMKVAARPISPSLSYLVEEALMEEEHPEVMGFSPGDGAVVGPTTLQSVLERWAAQPVA